MEVHAAVAGSPEVVGSAVAVVIAVVADTEDDKIIRSFFLLNLISYEENS